MVVISTLKALINDISEQWLTVSTIQTPSVRLIAVTPILDTKQKKKEIPTYRIPTLIFLGMLQEKTIDFLGLNRSVLRGCVSLINACVCSSGHQFQYASQCTGTGQVSGTFGM